MKIPTEIQQWCKQNGWTEPVFKQGNYYAFPPNAVIPQPIPISKEIFYLKTFCTSFCKVLLAGVIGWSFLTIACFCWNWRGIGSVYISQDNHQHKILACRSCPIDENSIVQLKEPSAPLGQVLATPANPNSRILATNYPSPNNLSCSEAHQYEEMVSGERIRGRVLYIFPNKLAISNNPCKL